MTLKTWLLENGKLEEVVRLAREDQSFPDGDEEEITRYLVKHLDMSSDRFGLFFVHLEFEFLSFHLDEVTDHLIAKLDEIADRSKARKAKGLRRWFL